MAVATCTNYRKQRLHEYHFFCVTVLLTSIYICFPSSQVSLRCALYQFPLLSCLPLCQEARLFPSEEATHWNHWKGSEITNNQWNCHSPLADPKLVYSSCIPTLSFAFNFLQHCDFFQKSYSCSHLYGLKRIFAVSQFDRNHSYPSSQNAAVCNKPLHCVAFYRTASVKFLHMHF